MSRDVVSLTLTSTVHEALSLAEQRNIHHFPVIADGRLAGIVCTCDLHEALLNDVISSRMRTDVATVACDASTRTALRLMDHRAVGSLLVLDGGMVRGIVTRNDLSKRCGSPSGGARCSKCRTQHRLRTASDGHHVCVECDGPRWSAPEETGPTD